MRKIAMTVAVLAITTVARGQDYRRPIRWVSAPQYAAPAYYYPAAMTPAVGGDPGAFLDWLNRTRVAYGLPAVGYDPTLEAWATANNNSQAAYGLGHFVMGPARRQNAAWNLGFPGVEAAWLASPGHASALLDPTIRFVGIAWSAGYATFNAY